MSLLNDLTTTFAEEGREHMANAIGRLADRMLVRLAPRIEASAGCTYRWWICYCRNGLRYSKRCMRGCPSVPDHCSSCTPVGTC